MERGRKREGKRYAELRRKAVRGEKGELEGYKMGRYNEKVEM